MTEARAECDAWNAAHDPGSRVWLHEADGTRRPARTESDAFRLGNVPCVMITGRGTYLLSAVSEREGKADMLAAAQREIAEATYRELAELSYGGW